MTTIPVSELSKEQRSALARDKSTPYTVLAELATDADDYIRQCVVENPNTPLSVLAKSDRWGVRQDVAANRNTPPEVLALLAQDESSYVRWFVARNPNTSFSLLLPLVQDEERAVRETVQQSLTARSAEFQEWVAQTHPELVGLPVEWVLETLAT